MVKQSRVLIVCLCALGLCSLLLAGLLQAGPLYAADTAAHSPAAAAQATPAPAATPVHPGGADHGAHHAGASPIMTNTTPAMGGMMGGGMMGMMGMMAHMGATHMENSAFHQQIADDLGAVIDENLDTLTPQVAAELGRIQGLLEGMAAVDHDMGGMMGGGMMGGGMMPGPMMSGTMPMSGSMPMSGATTCCMGMMGMVHAMHDEMAAMMPDMPDAMAAHMAQMQAMLDAMMGGEMGEMGMMGMMGATSMGEPFDARFIDSMIAHHQGAIEMAQQALDQAEHEELLSMAQGIVDAQQAEIDEMHDWRADWYPDLAPTAGMNMGMGAMALDTDASVPFDFRFLEAMIAHHAGAIAMAQTTLAGAEHAQVRQLAQDIIDAQQAEIEQMQQWAADWYPDLELSPDTSSMGSMGVMASMGAMQGMMHEMMAGGAMTPQMAARMGRMMGRMQGMMGGMMGGAWYDDNMMYDDSVHNGSDNHAGNGTDDAHDDAHNGSTDDTHDSTDD